MARLLVFADREPGDAEWKGSVVWDTIQSLAEAHHEVLALTPLDLSLLESVSHPRLTLAQPAPSFGLRYMGRWLRAILQFQPQIVHTFALRGDRPPDTGGSMRKSDMNGRREFSGVWASALRLADQVSAWPAMVQSLNAFPGVQRWSTVLDERDFAPFRVVRSPLELRVLGARSGSDEERAAGDESHEWLDSLPQDLSDSTSGLVSPSDHSPLFPFANYLVIPAPVSEWSRPQVDLLMLVDFLENNADIGACVVGGWGDWDLRQRRDGWNLLGALSARVHLTAPMNLDGLASLAQMSRGLWLRPLAPSSWRAIVAHRLADTFSLPTHGTPARSLPSGSTANFLSRLYSNN